LDSYSEKIVRFTIVYNKYKRKVYNYILRMVSDENLTEDLMQTVFLKLFENMDLIKNKNGIGSWLFTTTRNEIYGFFRAKKIKIDQFRSETLEDAHTVSYSDVQKNYDLKELKEIIFEELEKMPIEQKDVYLLKEYGGFSYKEIADILEIDVKTVKSRLYKVRQKLIGRIGKILLKDFTRVKNGQ